MHWPTPRFHTRFLPCAVAQVWHAVLGHVSGFEDALWECEGDAVAEQRAAAAIAAYRGAPLVGQ